MAEVSSGAEWTDAELAALRASCETRGTWEEVARSMPGRSAGAVKRRAAASGFALVRGAGASRARWTAADNRAMRENYERRGPHWDGWADLLSGPRTPKQIAEHARYMGLFVARRTGCGRTWTADEDATLARLYKEHGTRWAGWARALPDRSSSAIQARAGILGLRAGRAWTDEQDAQLAALARGLGKLWKRRPVDVAERMQIALENEGK